MSISIGGGSRGEGGKLEDSNDPVQPNYLNNRSLFDYSIPALTTDQQSLSPLDLTSTAEGSETDQFYIVSAGTDFLFCNRYVSGERQEELLRLSVPFTLRRSFWEGRTINGWTYSFTSYGTRVRTESTFGVRIEEHLWPAYQPGEVIFGTTSNTADGNLSLLVDINDAGRSWKPYSPQLCLVTAVGDNFLTCSALGDPSTTFLVVKPHTLRRTGWDGQTISGITYAYSSAQTRTASQAGEDDEDQLIIPPYIEGQSEIVVSQLPTSIAFGSQGSTLFDINADGRAWAKEPV